ncbi:glycosyltransferase family 2 protein [Geodermatophilus sp. URMC 61]|uniref:glycosyltransferase family 2 protein n=1 Tax=Geodermatophilus sp. URMC 61 TaxID=3423411 RepID=UPI00406D270B
MAPGRRIVVLIPAHDEAENIGATLVALGHQSRRPDRVVVIADNCADDTALIALAHGAEVFVTEDNHHKKAGALNQALEQRFRRRSARPRTSDPAVARRMTDRDQPAGRHRAADEPAGPDLRDDDYVLVMDADTVLSPRFLEVAAVSLDSSESIGAAGGLFFGRDDPGLLAELQRNEYVRYSRDIGRTGRVMVLTGTATLFRARALRDVADARGEVLPGTPGQVYDTLALTEDNELTLALKSLGWSLTSPLDCRVTTELMPTWRDLWKQRMRWQRGALENLRHYGWSRTTARYWAQQVGIGFGVLAFQAYLWLIVLLVTSGAGVRFSLFWTAVGVVFLLERIVTVWTAGWRARLVAAPLVLELCYDLFIQAVFVRSLLDLIGRRTATWHHVAPSSPLRLSEGG